MMNTEMMNTEANSTVLVPFIAVILQEVPLDRREPDKTGTGTGTSDGTADVD